MIFRACDQCGQVRETATIKINQLKRKLDQKIYLLKYGDAWDRLRSAPTENEIWEWSEELKKVLGAL